MGGSQLCINWCCWEVGYLCLSHRLYMQKKKKNPDLDCLRAFCEKWRLFYSDEEKLDTCATEEKRKTPRLVIITLDTGDEEG